MVPILKRYSFFCEAIASINGVGQDVLDDAEIPDIAPVFGVGFLPFGEGIPQAPLAVPPGGAWYPLCLQPSPDKVRAVTLQRPLEYLPNNGNRFLVDQQVVFVLRVFPVAEGGKAAGKLAFLRFQQIRGMNLLGDILAVHLVEDVLERGDVIAFPHGVDAVVHGDVPHTVTREEVLDEVAGLQIIAAQSRQIFRYNDIDLFAFDGFQHPLQRGSLHIQPCIAVVLVNFHDLPSLLFAVGFQHGPLVGDAGALALQVVVLRQAAVDCRPVRPGQKRPHLFVHGVLHNRSPRDPDGTRSLGTLLSVYRKSGPPARQPAACRS